MKMLLCAALAASMALAGCTAVAPQSAGQVVATAGAEVERAQARYDAVKPLALMLLPYLSEANAARVRQAMTIAETALAAALGGGVLELTGYNADAATQTASAIGGVSGLVGGAAPLFFLLALIPLYRYPSR